MPAFVPRDPMARVRGSAWALAPVARIGDAARSLRDILEDDRVTLLEGDAATGAGSVTPRREPTPQAIDIVMTEGAGRGQTARGVSEITGDRLRLCRGGERPAEFSGAGPEALVELQRVSPPPKSGRA